MRTIDIEVYECEDGHDAGVNKGEAVSTADDGSTQNVADCELSSFHLETSNIDAYEYTDGHTAEMNQEVESS